MSDLREFRQAIEQKSVSLSKTALPKSSTLLVQRGLLPAGWPGSGDVMDGVTSQGALRHVDCNDVMPAARGVAERQDPREESGVEVSRVALPVSR